MGQRKTFRNGSEVMHHYGCCQKWPVCRVCPEPDNADEAVELLREALQEYIAYRDSPIGKAIARGVAQAEEPNDTNL